MTRKEQIKQAADEYAFRASQAYKGVYCEYTNDKEAFVSGAEWADKTRKDKGGITITEQEVRDKLQEGYKKIHPKAVEMTSIIIDVYTEGLFTEQEVRDKPQEGYKKIHPKVEEMTDFIIDVYQEGFETCWKLFTGQDSSKEE